MEPEVRTRLRAGWGLCERHTAAWLVIETAFHHRYLHGPAVLYDDLMERAQRVFAGAAALSTDGRQQRFLARRLERRGPCHLCELGLGPDSPGFVAAARLQTGRDMSPLRAFMRETEPFWRRHVCGLCAGTQDPARCREHLCAQLSAGVDDAGGSSRDMADEIALHIRRYDESFAWELRGTDTVQDRAALVAAAGWSGGWRGLLGAFGGAAP